MTVTCVISAMIGEEQHIAVADGRAPSKPTQQFPAGLRVLLVDDDPVCLMVVGQMLRACQYEVCTCSAAASALDQLRSKKANFDLVLSDVYMPDMDGFKLLEIVGLELGLPVIMMSANDEHSTVMRGVTHGACDFLIKPVRLEELKNIWQHVVRRGKHNAAAVRDAESDDAPGDQDADSTRKRTVHSRDGSCNDGQQQQAREEEGAASKKPRVVWSVEMHQQFVHAVNQLGIDKAVPKKILELMKVEGLTRENVASHLQKYRLYLKRVQQNAPAQANNAANAGTSAAAAAAAAGGGSGSFIAAPGMPGMMGPGQMMWGGSSTQGIDALQAQQQAAGQQAVGGQQLMQQAAQQAQQQQQPGQQQLGGDGGMGALMGMMPGGGLTSPMGQMMPGMLMGMGGMTGLSGMNPMGPAAAGMMGLPGMSGFGAAMMGLMPGMPGMPIATQGMAAAMNPMGQLPSIRPGMPGDPAAVMAMMSANMQAMFQAQQQQQAAAGANMPSNSGGGSSGGIVSPQQQQHAQAQQLQQPGGGMAAAAAAGASSGMLPGMAGMPVKQEPKCALGPQAGAGMAAAMQQPAAAAPAVQQQQQQQAMGLLGGSSGGGAPGGTTMPMQQPPGAMAAAGVGAADFRNVFDDVFDAPAQRTAAVGGGGGGAMEDEFLDFILKGP